MKILLGIKVEGEKIKVNIKSQYDSNMTMYDLSRKIAKASGKMLQMVDFFFFKMVPRVSSTKLYHWIYISTNISYKKFIILDIGGRFSPYLPKMAKILPTKAKNSQFVDKLWYQ